MIELIILFWALVCPNPEHTTGIHGNSNMIQVTTNSTGDTGGETGNLPPKPPIPPPPPPFGG